MGSPANLTREHLALHFPKGIETVHNAWSPPSRGITEGLELAYVLKEDQMTYAATYTQKHIWAILGSDSFCVRGALLNMQPEGRRIPE